LPEVIPHDIVVEAFGCNLPESFLRAMASRNVVPVWLNLEYLSAEAWIEGCHRLSSRHTSLRLTRFFFFPGFSAKTGGLLREPDLFSKRMAFQASERRTSLAALGVPKDHIARDRIISLFCYENARLGDLLTHWLKSSPTTVLVADGKPRIQIAQWFGEPFPTGAVRHRGNLTLIALPFLSQDDYDHVLWASDVNFVRGEDSFVRAQWAARPFVWHIYPQEEAAHITKLDAFLQRYDLGSDTELAAAYRDFSMAWNGAQEYAIMACWDRLTSKLAPWEQHAVAWCSQLAQQDDLAAQLRKFALETLDSSD
jgi:uncharacterized repeat protein (TIGR03837 family)